MSAAPDPLTALTAARVLLEQSADKWSTVLEVSTAVVAIGVVMEVWAEIREKWHAGDSLRKHWLALTGAALVALAVGAEFLAEMKGGARETSLRTNNASAQAILTQRANDATADAVALTQKFGGLHDFVNAQSAQISSDMAALDRESAQLMRARDESVTSAASVAAALDRVRKVRSDLSAQLSTVTQLQTQVRTLTTPRTINVQRLSNELQQFGKVPFVIELNADTETAELTRQITDALTGAGWNWQNNKRADNGFEQGLRFEPDKPFMRLNIAQGVIVQIALSNKAILDAPLTALFKALQAEHLANVVGHYDTDEAMKNGSFVYGVIHVTVGSR